MSCQTTFTSGFTARRLALTLDVRTDDTPAASSVAPICSLGSSLFIGIDSSRKLCVNAFPISDVALATNTWHTIEVVVNVEYPGTTAYGRTWARQNGGTIVVSGDNVVAVTSTV